MARQSRLKTLARGSLEFISKNGERHMIVIMCFLGNFVSYGMRLSITQSLIQMVRHPIENETISSDSCPRPGNISAYAMSERYTSGDFDWTPGQESLAKGSFYYGYILTQIPAGYLSGSYSVKKLYFLGIFLTAIGTLLCPVAAWARFEFFIAMRILKGLGQGLAYPVISTLFGRWAPPSERTRMLAVSNAGAQAGTVIVLPISSALGLAFGWESIYYIFGGLGLLFLILWWLFVFDSPEEHPRITAEEKSYIISSIGAPAMGAKAPSVPWKRVATSLPVWSIIIAWWCTDWGFYTLLNDVSDWLNGSLHFEMKSNGGISCLPYLFMFLFTVGFSYVADFLVKREFLTRTVMRKLFTCLGMFIPALFLVGMGYAGCSQAVAVVLLVFSVATTGFGSLGFRINFNDISPSYAGVLVAIANTISTATGFVGPEVTRHYTSPENGGNKMSNWRSVFLITAAQYVVGAIVFTMFGSADMQTWDYRSSNFEEKRIAPETVASSSEAAATKQKRKSSVTPWIPPSSEPTEGVKEAVEKRRRSSIPPWVANAGDQQAVDNFVAQGRRRSMLQPQPLTVMVEPTQAANENVV